MAPQWFATTHWTVVLAAGGDGSAAAELALAQLCRTYWPPVHAYVRRWGYSPADADDLTQQFFMRFIEKKQYRSANPTLGRFRYYLLTSLKHFLLKEQERASAQKRGGRAQMVSMDEPAPEGALPLELKDERSADRVFERNWALALLGRARERLAAEYTRAAKAERFAYLEKFLPGEQCDLTYSDVARLLGVAEGTIKSDMHRLKRRYGALVREEVAHTVATPDEVEEELRHLRTVLGRAGT